MKKLNKFIDTHTHTHTCTQITFKLCQRLGAKVTSLDRLQSNRTTLLLLLLFLLLLLSIGRLSAIRRLSETHRAHLNAIKR